MTMMMRSTITWMRNYDAYKTKILIVLLLMLRHRLDFIFFVCFCYFHILYENFKHYGWEFWYVLFNFYSFFSHSTDVCFCAYNKIKEHVRFSFFFKSKQYLQPWLMMIITMIWMAWSLVKANVGDAMLCQWWWYAVMLLPCYIWALMKVYKTYNICNSNNTKYHILDHLYIYTRIHMYIFYLFVIRKQKNINTILLGIWF